MSEEELAQLRKTLTKTNQEIGDHLRKKHPDGRPSETCHDCIRLTQRRIFLGSEIAEHKDKKH